MPATSKLHANIGDGFCQNAVRSLFIERRRDSIPADFLIANENLDSRRVDLDARSPDSSKNASPIRIGPGRFFGCQQIAVNYIRSRESLEVPPAAGT
jgi:hypothetical protein